MDRLLIIVVDMESDPPRLAGTYERMGEDTVFYTDTDGRLKQAPEDCVSIKSVTVQQSERI